MNLSDVSFDTIYNIIVLALGLFSFVFSFVRTHNLKSSISNFKEVSELKYDTVEKKLKNKDSYSQEFSEFVPDYILNPSTNELERLAVDKNIQKQIQSFIDVALNNALERLLPQVPEVKSDTVNNYSEKVQDLASFADVIDLAESYRDKYNLPDSYTISDIYSFVDKEAKLLKEKISSFNKPKDDKEFKKEDIKDE